MATVVARTHNPVIKSFADRLRAAGTPFKVAVIACMRKRLPILNPMVKAKQPWGTRCAAQNP